VTEAFAVMVRADVANLMGQHSGQSILVSADA
jgi:hypothetical protein